MQAGLGLIRIPQISNLIEICSTQTASLPRRPHRFAAVARESARPLPRLFLIEEEESSSLSGREILAMVKEEEEELVVEVQHPAHPLKRALLLVKLTMTTYNKNIKRSAELIESSSAAQRIKQLQLPH